MRASMHTRRYHTVRQESFVAGLCTECASQRKNLEEMAGQHTLSDHHFSKMSLPQVWIDGICHVLRPTVTQCGMCSDCGRKVMAIYVPAGS